MVIKLDIRKNITAKLGFTLIEMIVVIGVFAAIGTIILIVMFIALRASRKSDVLINIRQNGNTAMSQMIKSIRYAKSVYDHDNPNVTLTCVPSNTLTDGIDIVSLLDEGTTTYACPAAPGGSISSNSAALIDNSSVQVSACSITCTQATVSDIPTIKINFTLSALTNGALNTLVENKSSVNFQSSVIPRNYNTSQ